jgi:hypothetical protein
MSINRRGFLQFSSAAILSQFLSPSTAKASQTPKRLIIFHWPQGVVMPQFLPYSDGSFPYILEPLIPHRSHMTMISGIDNVIPNFNTVPTVHPNADHSLFTCTPFLIQNPNQLTPSGPSFEQVISEQISLNTPYPRLDFAVGGPKTPSGTFRPSSSAYFWHQANDPVTCFNDPVTAALRIFGDQSLSTADRWAIRSEQSNVLDGVLQQFSALDQRLTQADRNLLYPHWERLEQLEQRITNGTTECFPPQFELPTQYNYAMDDHISAPLLNDLLVTSLACNYSNVATLHFANNNDHNFHWLWPRNGGQPIVNTERYGNWHSMVHADYQPGMEIVFRWYMEMLADLLEKLKNTFDSDGDRMLDGSIVVAVSEFSSGRHWFSNLPILIFGPLEGDRHINFMPDDWDAYENLEGRISSEKNTLQLWRALMDLFEVPNNDFGFRDSSFDDRPLDIL